MGVTILDHCPSCGKCSRPGVCPTDAIKVKDGNTFIGEGCIDCGLCIPVCPIGVIVETSSDTHLVDLVELTPEVEAQLTNGSTMRTKDVAVREEEEHGQTSTGA